MNHMILMTIDRQGKNSRVKGNESCIIFQWDLHCVHFCTIANPKVQKCISTVLSSFNIFWHKCLVFAQTKQVPLVQTNLIIIYPKKSFHFQKRQKFILLFFVWYLTIKTLLTKTGFP